MAFVVFSLPRSRSTWMSVFLSRGRIVGHDIGADCESPEDFIARLGAGTCETGAAFAWKLIRRLRPDVKFAVLLKDPLEVCKSLEKFGLTGFLPEMQRRDDDLWEIAEQPGTLVLETLDETSCAQLYEFCLETPFDRDWFRFLDPINIQVDMQRQIEKLVSGHHRIEHLKNEVRRCMTSG